jgi:hypothetical protein
MHLPGTITYSCTLHLEKLQIAMQNEHILCVYEHVQCVHSWWEHVLLLLLLCSCCCCVRDSLLLL